MFATRLLTAVALLGGFLAAVLFLERSAFAVLIALIVGLAGHEWGRLCRMPARSAAGYGLALAALFGLVAWRLFPVSASSPALGAVFAAAAAFWIVVVPAWLRKGFGDGRLLPAIGPVVVLPAALALLALSGPQVLMVLALIWVADTAAYLTGRAFGRHKLAPSISPGKTWEGAGGAFAGALAYAIVCARLVPPLSQAVHGAGWPLYLGAAALLCGVSILGDLFESAIKRHASVKDSGSLLPGHGGVLDRIDSATSTLPIAALMLQWIAPT